VKQLFDDFPVRLVGLAGFLILVVLVVMTVQVLLVPFVAAMFLAYLYDPVIEALQRRGVRRGRAYLLLFGLTLLAILILIVVAPDWLRLESTSGSAETLSDRLTQQLTGFERFVDTRLPMFRSVRIADQVSERAASVANQFMMELPSIVTSFAVNLFLVPIIAYFIVKDGRKLRRHIVSLLPNRYFEMAMMMFYRIDGQIGAYLRGRLIECMLVAAVQMLLMAVGAIYVPLPHILLISAVGGVTNLIPYVGPLLGSAFGVFLYISGDYPMASVWVLLGIVALAHLIDNLIIAPAVLSQNVGLHPLTVVLVLVIGGEVLGVLGLLIAIPVASSIKIVVQEFYANYQAQVR
jgi:predicted PurR-regulated permease PerM